VVGDTITLAPPLVATMDDIADIRDRLAAVLAQVR
jgi:adenosylmethionine-8-amino-7-oxononanoate aminotransferase